MNAQDIETNKRVLNAVTPALYILSSQWLKQGDNIL